MTSSPIRRAAIAALPAGVRIWLRDRHRARALARGLQALEALVSQKDSQIPEGLLRQLVYGWGNEGMSAETEFLAAIIRLGRQSTGPILEMGCGLSTLVLAVAARARRVPVISLEHQPEWRDRVVAALARIEHGPVEIIHAPLRSYGEFSWYGVEPSQLPKSIALLVCDGPPGDTPGGRIGALPVLSAHLDAGCLVMLDDAARPDEQRALARWSADFGLAYEFSGCEKPFAIGRLARGALAATGTS
jgi:hypothetical protein